GITKDPKTFEYMVVMKYLEVEVSEIICKKICKWKWDKRLKILFHIISGLIGIHQSNLFTEILHSRNILVYGAPDEKVYNDVSLITDLGLSVP
ncbi:22914_t:CDS:1, partial [Gigaspora margarita]